MILRLSPTGVVCGVCSGPILNQEKTGKESRKNQGNIKENDFPDLADTLY